MYILSFAHKKRREMRLKRVQYIVIATWIDEGLSGIAQCLHKIASLHQIPRSNIWPRETLNAWVNKSVKTIITLQGPHKVLLERELVAENRRKWKLLIAPNEASNPFLLQVRFNSPWCSIILYPAVLISPKRKRSYLQDVYALWLAKTEQWLVNDFMHKHVARDVCWYCIIDRWTACLNYYYIIFTNPFD